MRATATSVRNEIRRANTTFEAAFERGDVDAITALYTSAAVLLPPNQRPFQGAADISAFWSGAMQMGVGRVKLDTQSVEELRDTAIELGEYQFFGTDGQQIDHGKYLVVWIEQMGQWLLHQDIWNTSQPAPGQ